jgi:hypothetical protein
MRGKIAGWVLLVANLGCACCDVVSGVQTANAIYAALLLLNAPTAAWLYYELERA